MNIPLAQNVAPNPDQDIVGLVRQAQGGSHLAARALFDGYRRPLLGIIRQRLRPRLRTLFDSDDFLMATFAEVFTRHFSQDVLRGPETLWPYLVTIARNKVRDAERKYFLTERNDLNREVHFCDIGPDDEPWARGLSALDAIILKELVEEQLGDLVLQLPSMLQTIIHLLLEGNSGLEIARRLQVEPKRVYRAIKWLAKRIDP
jgi:RNA polymerase sigma factor (sigma-70 family)